MILSQKILWSIQLYGLIVLFKDKELKTFVLDIADFRFSYTHVILF